MATLLVQELTEEGAYDLDADPAVEGANEATWLDADSVSPALARDKKLAGRVQALERAIAARGDEARHTRYTSSEPQRCRTPPPPSPRASKLPPPPLASSLC